MIDKCVRHRNLRGAGKFIAFDSAKRRARLPPGHD
jgi:hypothetical protein